MGEFLPSWLGWSGNNSGAVSDCHAWLKRHLKCLVSYIIWERHWLWIKVQGFVIVCPPLFCTAYSSATLICIPPSKDACRLCASLAYSWVASPPQTCQRAYIVPRNLHDSVFMTGSSFSLRYSCLANIIQLAHRIQVADQNRHFWQISMTVEKLHMQSIRVTKNVIYPQHTVAYTKSWFQVQFKGGGETDGKNTP